MSDAARLLLIQGMAAAKAGAKHDARYYLERLLSSDPGGRQLLDA